MIIPVGDDSGQHLVRVTLETDDNGKESLSWTGRENGKQVVFDSEPYASTGLKLAVAFMKLLPIESQL